jgi:hypothetical protein
VSDDSCSSLSRVESTSLISVSSRPIRTHTVTYRPRFDYIILQVFQELGLELRRPAVSRELSSLMGHVVEVLKEKCTNGGWKADFDELVATFRDQHRLTQRLSPKLTKIFIAATFVARIRYQRKRADRGLVGFIPHRF